MYIGVGTPSDVCGHCGSQTMLRATDGWLHCGCGQPWTTAAGIPLNPQLWP